MPLRKRNPCRQPRRPASGGGDIYENLASGRRDDGPGLEACLKALQPGNILVVWKLDRLGRDLKHLVAVVDELRSQGVGFRVLAGAEIDTTTANGRLVFGIFTSGIACVAMLAGKSYRAVAKEMFPDGVVSGTNTRDLRRALAACGLEPARHLVPFRSTQYQDLQDSAILKANPRRGGAEWHWVVWDAERRRLLDPRNPPHKRIRACSYLRVR